MKNKRTINATGDAVISVFKKDGIHFLNFPASEIRCIKWGRIAKETTPSKNPLRWFFGKRATTHTFSRIKNNTYPLEVLGGVRHCNIESFTPIKETLDGKTWYTKVRIWSTKEARAFLENALLQGFEGHVTAHWWKDTEVVLTCNATICHIDIRY